MLASVPLDIASHLEQLLILLQEKSMARISCLKSLYKLHTDALNSQDFNQNSGVDTLCCLESDSGPYALLIATYQPSSQRFERADLNQRMEDLLGVPWVTDAGLRTTRGLAIPMPAWDSLCMLVDTMLHLSTSTGIRYFRCYSAHHCRNRFILVSGTQSKVFNSVGEVVQVPFHLSAHSSKDPGHLPAVLHSRSDMRFGRSLPASTTLPSRQRRNYAHLSSWATYALAASSSLMPASPLTSCPWLWGAPITCSYAVFSPPAAQSSRPISLLSHLRVLQAQNQLLRRRLQRT